MLFGLFIIDRTAYFLQKQATAWKSSDHSVTPLEASTKLRAINRTRHHRSLAKLGLVFRLIAADDVKLVLCINLHPRTGEAFSGPSCPKVEQSCYAPLAPHIPLHQPRLLAFAHSFDRAPSLEESMLFSFGSSLNRPSVDHLDHHK